MCSPPIYLSNNFELGTTYDRLSSVFPAKPLSTSYLSPSMTRKHPKLDSHPPDLSLPVPNDLIHSQTVG